MDLVSIVVPVYNMKNYLDRCMNSLLNQTYSNIEIILIDDGSTDGSKEICDIYQSNYPDKILAIHKKNGGLSSARNEGIKYASGKYIVFPDPDDWVEPNYVSRAMELQGQYHVDLVCLGYYIDYDYYSIPVNISVKACEFNQENAKLALLLPPQISGFAWNKFYKKDIIEKNNLSFLDDVGTTEDLDFAFRYLQLCNKVYFDPASRVYHYYQRDGAATNSGFSLKKVKSIHTYEKIIRESNSSEYLRKAAQCEICNTAINLILMYKNDGCDDKETWFLLRSYLKNNLSALLTSHHSLSRKIQGLLAYFVPNIFVKIKNVSRDR